MNSIKTFVYKNLIEKDGQALTESIILIPTLILIVVAITWFSRVVITKQQLVSAARYGTDLIVYTNLTENEIERDIRNYLTHGWNAGRKLDPAKLRDENINVEIKYFDLPDFTFFDYFVPQWFIAKILRILPKLDNPFNQTSYVDIYYEFDLPPIFSMTGVRSIPIRAHSEVLAKTGCKGDIHKMRTR